MPNLLRFYLSVRHCNITEYTSHGSWTTLIQMLPNASKNVLYYTICRIETVLAAGNRLLVKQIGGILWPFVIFMIMGFL